MTTTVSGLGVKFLCSLCTECPCCRRMERNMSRRWTCRLCSVVAGYIHSLVAQRAPVGRRQVAVHMQYMEWLLLAQDQHAWDSPLHLPCAARDAWYTLTEMHPVQWMNVTCSLVPRPCLASVARGPTQLSVACHTASDGKLGGAWERGYVTCRSAFFREMWSIDCSCIHVHTCNVHA